MVEQIVVDKQIVYCPNCETEILISADDREIDTFVCPSCGMVKFEEQKSNLRNFFSSDQKFNFAAFLITPIWLIFHGKAWIGVSLFIFNVVAVILAIIGFWETFLIQLLVALYFGAVGNDIAYIYHNCQTDDDLYLSQRPWKIGAWLVFVILLTCFAIIWLQLGMQHLPKLV